MSFSEITCLQIPVDKEFQYIEQVCYFVNGQHGTGN